MGMSEQDVSGDKLSECRGLRHLWCLWRAEATRFGVSPEMLLIINLRRWWFSRRA
jgi:hypothetical protein